MWKKRRGEGSVAIQTWVLLIRTHPPDKWTNTHTHALSLPARGSGAGPAVTDRCSDVRAAFELRSFTVPQG